METRSRGIHTLYMRVQSAVQHLSLRLVQGAEDRLFTPHFILPVALGPDVAKMRCHCELCSLLVKVETFITAKGPCSANAASASVIRIVTTVLHSGAWH
jgi:hypothetical protein